MFKSVRMSKLNVLVLGRYVTPLTRALGSQGLMHLVDAVAQSEHHLLEGVSRETEIRDIEQLAEACLVQLDALGVSPETAPAAVSFDRPGIEALLASVQAQHRQIEERLQHLLHESGLLSKDADRLRGCPVQTVPIDALRQISLLYMTAGRLPPSHVPLAAVALADRGLLLHDDVDPARRGNVLVLAPRWARQTVDTELARLGFVAADLPESAKGSASQEQCRLDDRLAAARTQVESVRREMAALAQAQGASLVAARRQLQATLAVLRAQQCFGRSAMIYCISGWVPRDRVAAVKRTVDTVTGGSGLVEEVQPEADGRVLDGQEAVPVQFTPNRWLGPFQGLITAFGAPRYDDVDPSAFVALSFVLMFGIMFGDVGQGLAIALLGLWLHRTRRPALAPFRQGGVLLLFCGLSATAFGFCYGSVFGYENAGFLRPLWLSPLHDITRMLKAAVVLGILCISGAVLINIVNRLRNRRWFDCVFDKFGVLGIVFYWGALGIGLKAAKAGELDAGQFVFLVILPLALLFLREPLHNLLHRRPLLQGGPVALFLEACVETLETVTVFLGSTVSFVRVGAFALSHAALCLAIFSVVDILDKLPGGGLWSVLVLIFGNLLVIFMEGMVAMIQGVRLQYYELFSKYFPGDGTLYHPFVLSEQPLVQEKGEQDA
jgi:V/A-type H+-transporting ATPase subunit I